MIFDLSTLHPLSGSDYRCSSCLLNLWPELFDFRPARYKREHHPQGVVFLVGGDDESMGELKKVPILPELNLISILFRGIFSMVRVLLPPLRIKVKYSSYKYIRLTKIVTSAFLFTKLVHDKLLI